jgi:hypothetical protein
VTLGAIFLFKSGESEGRLYPTTTNNATSEEENCERVSGMTRDASDVASGPPEDASNPGENSANQAAKQRMAAQPVD